MRREAWIAFSLGWILVLMAIWVASCAGADGVLNYTLPCIEARQDSVLDDAGRPMFDDAGNAILVSTCLPGVNSLVDLNEVLLYAYPITGGGFRYLRSKDVRGRECQDDTLQVPLGWSFKITTKDITGNESCESGTVNMPGTTTAVADGVVLDLVERTMIFDVAGRLVERIAASGVYYQRTIYRSKRTSTKMVYVK